MLYFLNREEDLYFLQHGKPNVPTKIVIPVSFTLWGHAGPHDENNL